MEISLSNSLFCWLTGPSCMFCICHVNRVNRHFSCHSTYRHIVTARYITLKGVQGFHSKKRPSSHGMWVKLKWKDNTLAHCWNILVGGLSWSLLNNISLKPNIRIFYDHRRTVVIYGEQTAWNGEEGEKGEGLTHVSQTLKSENNASLWLKFRVHVSRKFPK